VYERTLLDLKDLELVARRIHDLSSFFAGRADPLDEILRTRQLLNKHFDRNYLGQTMFAIPAPAPIFMASVPKATSIYLEQIWTINYTPEVLKHPFGAFDPGVHVFWETGPRVPRPVVHPDGSVLAYTMPTVTWQLGNEDFTAVIRSMQESVDGDWSGMLEVGEPRITPDVLYIITRRGDRLTIVDHKNARINNIDLSADQ
jgi:hypothetical protein